MIELIKLNKIDDAILFGQTDLLPLLEKEVKQFNMI